MTVSEAVDHASGYADARPTWAEVDLDAITHNIALIRERAGRPIKLLVPVKANAYGHGVAAVGMHLESLGVDGLATANVDDAVAVRRAGATLPILLYGAQLPSGNHYLLQHDLTPTVYSAESLQSISGLATDSGRRRERAHQGRRRDGSARRATRRRGGVCP